MKRFSFLLILNVICINTYSQQNQLNIPEALSGEQINLTLQKGKVSFLPGDSTNTMGINGNILGPTLVLNKWQNVDIKIENKIDETTTIHWHGMHVSSSNDGGPHTTIAPNETWNPKFQVLDHAATYWYHPHLHEKTNEHVLKGMAGMIIVKDSVEASLNLPRTYGVDDIPLVIQSKAFDSINTNQIDVMSALDSNIIINGTINPYADIPGQVVRFRLLNGSSERYYYYGFNDGRDFYQIASDGGLLNYAYKAKKLLLAPGERMEILVDFSNQVDSTVYLMSYGSELGSGYYGSNAMGNVIEGYYDNPLNGNDYNLLKINVKAPTANPINTIQLTKQTNDEPLVHWFGTKERNITFGVASNGNGITGPFGFVNRGLFDMNRIDDTVGVGHTEVWNLANGTMLAHPFHIHDVQFYILKRNGSENFEPNEKGRKDVVIVPPMGTVQFIAEFNDFANDSIPYMYHCHMLTHEDGGMMGQFIVIDMPESIEEDVSKSSIFKISPNPTNGQFNIILDNNNYADVSVFNVFGKEIYHNIKYINEPIELNGLSNGVYLVKVNQGGKTMTKKLVKR